MPRKKQSKRINIDSRERWKSIIKTVSKDEVPVVLLNAITVNLIDGTKVDIDIVELLNEGLDPSDVEEMLNSRLTKLDSIIKDIDFYINLDQVAKTVQPVTDDILKNL